LLSSEHLVKIADFGSAMIYQESEGTWEGPVNGTPAFRPPETLTATGRLTRKVLVHSLRNVCTLLTPSLPYPLTHSLTHSLPHSLTHSLTHPLTHSHTHSPTHPPTHSPTHSPTHASACK